MTIMTTMTRVTRMTTTTLMRLVRRSTLFHLPVTLLAAFVFAAVPLSAAAPAAKAPPKPPKEAKAIADANNAFAAELYGKLRTAEKGNLFFSPYSISTALAMTHAGAAGKTQAEIAQVLHLAGDLPAVNKGYDALTGYLNAGGKTGGYQLSVANAFWGQPEGRFLADYIQTLRNSYSANLFDVDFKSDPDAARARINQWVQEQTKDKIKDLMPQGSISQMTRLVLTNAIYFKGDWEDPFNKKRTRDMPFDTAAGEQVTVPMMYQSRRYQYLAAEDYQAIALPYKASELAMVVLLPKAKDGLEQLEKKLSGEGLMETLKKLSASPARKVDTFIPRFKTTSSFSLKDTLSALGMPTAFTEEADLSGINGKRDLYIQAAIHKAYVDVNEEGTEAAAATGIAVGVTSAPADPLIFKADHPFVFLIQDRATGAVLFMGRIMNPVAK